MLVADTFDLGYFICRRRALIVATPMYIHIDELVSLFLEIGKVCSGFRELIIQSQFPSIDRNCRPLVNRLRNEMVRVCFSHVTEPR